MKSSAIDLTTGGVLRKIIPFAIPVLLGNVLQECYSLVDTLIVGQTLGVNKLASVGLTGALSFFLVGFCVGLSSGSSVLTSQYRGAGDGEMVKKSVAAHIVISVAAAITLTIVFALCAGGMLKLMNTSPENFDDANRYITIIFLGTPAMVLYNFLSATLRSVGDSRTPLYLLIVSSVLNIGLDILMIVVFRWDVAGAAIATVTAQLLSAVLCLVYAFHKMKFLIPDRSSWKNLGRMIREEVKVGLPMGIQLSIIAVGMIVLQYVLNGFGSDAVASYTVGSRIINLCQNPMISIGSVTAIFVGQNIGARQYERIRTGVTRIMLLTLALGAVLGGVILLASRPITTLFVDPSEIAVFDYVDQFFRWNCPLLWIQAFLFVYRGAVQGMGDGMLPLVSGIVELVMRSAVPLVFVGILGYTSICIANPAAWAGGAVLVTIVYFVKIRHLR